MLLYHKLENKTKVKIRKVKEKDAEKLLQYIKDCARTSEYLLLTEGEVQYTLDEELAFIKSFTTNKKQLYLVAFVGDEIVANVSIDVSSEFKTKHIGNLGIAVSNKHRGLGIGKTMMNTAIKWAKENKHIEIIALDVFDNNTVAIDLYKKLGFEEAGHFPDYFRQIGGEYVGRIIMKLNVK